MALIALHPPWHDDLKAYNSIRDSERTRKGLKAISQLKPGELDALGSSGEKSAYIALEMYRMTSQASPLEKYPLHHTPAPCDGVLLCPQTYQSASGTGKGRKPISKVYFREGDDLLQHVYYHYSELATDDEKNGALNYVSSTEVGVRRHELLGPGPRISGFRQVTKREWEVLFWDSYLKSAWCGSAKWSLDAEFDESVHSWYSTIHLS